MHDEALAKAIREDYTRGMSYKELIEKYDVSYAFISRMISKYNIPKRLNKIKVDESEYANIEKLYKDGSSMKIIAEKYNCSVRQITNILDRMSVKHKKDNCNKDTMEIKNTYLSYSDKFTIGQVVKTTEGKGIIKERNKDNFLIQFKNYAESFTLWQLWKANYSVAKEG